MFNRRSQAGEQVRDIWKQKGPDYRPFCMGKYMWCYRVRKMQRCVGEERSSGIAAPLYPLPWSETPATSFLLTREAALDAIGASGFVMQAERDVSQEALGWFQRTIGAALQGPNLSVVMGPRTAMMAPNLARSVREGSLGLLMGLARAI
jgi:hypothetical protein